MGPCSGQAANMATAEGKEEEPEEEEEEEAAALQVASSLPSAFVGFLPKAAPINEATDPRLQREKTERMAHMASFCFSYLSGWSPQEQLFGDVGRWTAGLLKAPGGLGGGRKRRRLSAE